MTLGTTSGRRTVMAGTLLVAALTGCGSDPDGSSAVDVAQARVSAAEEDLTDARADFTDASAEFCGASEDYILALDRYGDVLTQTAVTVGDVNDAGSDLEEPREDALAGAEAAVAAQQAVVDAEQDLTEAKAELKAAKNAGSSTTPAPTTASSPTPLAPEASVNRVERAEQELKAARQGITDSTPLAQASQQFNAAVVALEMAWLGLFAEAGCLTDEQQVQAEAAVRAYATALQTSLRNAGYYDGEVDGIYGPATVEAVEGLQEAHGLPSTGVVDRATAAALQDDLDAQGGAVAQQELTATAAVQQTLRLAGFWDGPVDGTWTPALTEAMKDFQTALGVEPSGTVDAATLAALEKAIAEARAEPSDSPTSEPSTAAPSDTATPTASDDASG
jgi:murein L,D-transpeptidase YcbB/YkuD